MSTAPERRVRPGGPPVQVARPLLRLVDDKAAGGGGTAPGPPKKLRSALAGAKPGKELLARGDALIRAAEDEAREAAAAARAANRKAAYLRRRPKRYVKTSYERLKPAQDPRGLVSRWLASDRRSALFAGNSRAGKSTAAYAICNAANAAPGVWVEAWTAFDMWRMLRSEGDDGACWHRLTQCDLLLIDDLGRERVTDAWREHLTEVLEQRATAGRRLLVTANTPPDAAAAYDYLVKPPAEGGGGYGDPVVERILDGGGIVVFDGPPIRDVVADW